MRRSAMTLLEVLVCLVITFIMMALLAPAVMSARESVRQITCGSNLRQLGLATHLFHDIHYELPSTQRSGPQRPTENGWSLLSATLPFVEQTNFHDRLTIASPNASTVNRALLTLQSPLHGCPSDTGPTVFSATFKNYELETASASYVGCDPAIGDHTHVRFGKITDGLTNTLMIGEVHRSSIFGVAVLGVLSNGNEYALNTEPTLPIIRECKPGSANTLYGTFGSNHYKRANFCFADGSVRTIVSDIDDQLFEALGTLAGGEVLEEF